MGTTDFSIRQVKSEKSQKYLWYLWASSGYYPNPEYTFLQKLQLTLVMIGVDLFTLVTLTAQLFFLTTFKQILIILPASISTITCILKYIQFLRMRLQLLDIDVLFTKLDSKRFNARQVKKMEKLVVFCQRYTLVVLMMYQLGVASDALFAARSNGETLMFNAWMPYNYHDFPVRFWLTLIYEYGCYIILVSHDAATDVSGPMYLMMLNAHLEILLERFAGVGWDPSKTQEENYQELINCIEDHRIIMKVFDVLQDTVSYTIFIQFVGTALVLCMEGLLFLLYPPNLIETIAILFFFIGVIIQILPCCYYSNKFMIITDRTVTAIYSANLFDQSPKFRKVAIIFMQMTQNSRVIVAGKVIPVTLGTFASILKLSYSLFTLANRLQ